MRRKSVFELIIVLVGVIFFLYLLITIPKLKEMQSKLTKEGIVDTAVVVREFIGAKSKLYYEYVFYVGNELNNGFLQYSPSYGSINVGDSFLVRYLKENPNDINELLKDKSKKVIKVPSHSLDEAVSKKQK